MAWKRFFALLSVFLLPLLLSGCMMMASVEELYALPQPPDEYQALSRQIDAILADRAEITSPAYGSNLQSVQLEDLDGDGVSEAIVFFRKNEDERPMKVYIFRETDGIYEQAALIEGSGTSIHSISYLDMNGDGSRELLISWRISAQVQALSVYTLDKLQPVLLMSAAYVRYETVDLDGDDMLELVVLRGDEGETGTSLADYYDWDGASLLLHSSARLSVSLGELHWMQIGALESGEAAVFVTGRVAGVEETSRAVTDILIFREGELNNVVLSQSTGMSSQVARFLNIQPADIDGDGATEVPKPASLIPVKAGDEMWKVYWFGYTTDGSSASSALTYHNLTDSWYLMIPEEWDGRFTVSQDNTSTSEHATTFYSLSGRNVYEKLFTIYTIVGDNREAQASRGGRRILRRQFNAVYAVEFAPYYDEWRYAVDQDDLIARFNAIITQWSTGEE